MSKKLRIFGAFSSRYFLRVPSSFTLSVAVGLAFSTLSCATAPRFHPSVPLAQAESLEESLQICGEYRIDRASSRPIALRPFLECLDDAATLQPVQKPEGFLVFRDELRQKFELLREEEWTPLLAARLDASVHALLRALWRGIRFEGRFSLKERDVVLKDFPYTAQVLKASQWAVVPHAAVNSSAAEGVALDPALEKLRGGVTAFMRIHEERLAYQPELRQRIENIAQETEYLGALWEDLLAMKALSAAPRKKVEERYRFRLETARNLLEKARKETSAGEEPLHA